MIYHLALLLLGAVLIDGSPHPGGGGGGGKGGGGGGKGGGGGGKGGGGGGKGGGGGGKKGLHGSWGRVSPVPAGTDYRAYYGELFQDPAPFEPSQRIGHEPGILRGYDQNTHRAAYDYAPQSNSLYTDYGKVADYGKGAGYPVTQGWHGSYDSGWQGTGGPVGYYNPYVLDHDDRAALYLRKGMQIGQEGGYRTKKEGRTSDRIR